MAEPAEWQSGRVDRVAEFYKQLCQNSAGRVAEWQSGRVGRVLIMPNLLCKKLFAAIEPQSLIVNGHSVLELGELESF